MGAPTTPAPTTSAPTTPAQPPSKPELVWRYETTGTMEVAPGGKHALIQHEDQEGVLILVDLNDGREVWRKIVHGPCAIGGMVSCHEEGKMRFFNLAGVELAAIDFVDPIFVASLDYVAVLEGKDRARLAVFNNEAERVWEKLLETDGKHIGTLQLKGHLLGVGLGEHLDGYGFDAATGRQIFRAKGTPEPTSAGFSVSVGDDQHRFYREDGSGVEVALAIFDLTTDYQHSELAAYSFYEVSRVDSALYPKFTMRTDAVLQLACGHYTVLATERWASDQYVLVVAEDGEKLWQENLGEAFRGVKCAGSGFVGFSSEGLIAKDLISGVQYWQVPIPSGVTARDTALGILVSTEKTMELYR